MNIHGKLNDCVATLSARDTDEWASKPGAAWPCSTLAGHRIRVEISGGDLVDITVDGKDSDKFGGDVDGVELDAILADFGIRNVNL